MHFTLYDLAGGPTWAPPTIVLKNANYTHRPITDPFKQSCIEPFMHSSSTRKKGCRACFRPASLTLTFNSPHKSRSLHDFYLSINIEQQFNQYE